MKKKQLLQAMKSLPMLAEDKEKFVNIILDNSGRGNQDDIRYYMYKDLLNIDDNQVEELFQSYIDSAVYDSYEYKGIINYFLVDNEHSNILAISINFNRLMGGYIEESSVVIFNHFFEALTAHGKSEYIDIINNLPTITREEFINLVKQ